MENSIMIINEYSLPICQQEKISLLKRIKGKLELKISRMSLIRLIKDNFQALMKVSNQTSFLLLLKQFFALTHLAVQRIVP